VVAPRPTDAILTGTRAGVEGECDEIATMPRAADVLVIFGVTGDLAKVMTFRSLYRLEARGLLDCPVVGVAVDGWTVDDLRKRARESLEADGGAIDDEGFDRFSNRLS
jgi:glucose-6-phosphate 1-dehydrogenase